MLPSIRLLHKRVSTDSKSKSLTKRGNLGLAAGILTVFQPAAGFRI